MSEDKTPQTQIDTDGGAYVEGKVDTRGGDFVGRDQFRIGALVKIVFGRSTAISPEQARRNREAMLQKVHHDWIDGVLNKSLYREARIDLGLEEQPDAVAHPWDTIVQEQGRPLRDLVPGTPMGTVFDDLGGALLILGAPGSGKTTLLLELAEDLLDRAERDDGHRIPVVFNLSSWAVERKPLAEWLVDELNQRYDVSRKMGQAWVDADAILPLLDGLDEVAQEHREKCAEAINAFRANHGLVPFAVCSRAEEYKAVTAKLRLSGAILIHPMTHGQVDGYLARAGQRLTGVREALQAEETLYELFDTSLMLSIAALAYQNASVDAVQTQGSVDERRERLFATYVDAMFERRSKEHTYTRTQTERWLKWLAGQMVDHNQSVFYLERMQPDWLPRRWKRTTVQLAIAIAYILLFGVVLPAVFLEEMFDPVFLVCAILIGALVGYSQSIRPVETLSWSWLNVRKSLRSVGLTALSVVLFSVLLGVLLAIFVPAEGMGLGLWLLIMFLSGLLLALMIGLLLVLFAGLTGGELSTRAYPNQGMRRSGRNALISGLLVGSFVGFTVGLILLRGKDTRAYPAFLLAGQLSVGLWYGGRSYLQHLILRVLLWNGDLAPLGYARFLDYAAERILLRKVGGGYIFVHRLLQEHFASKWQGD
jgi:hypothetical protein